MSTCRPEESKENRAPYEQEPKSPGHSLCNREAHLRSPDRTAAGLKSSRLGRQKSPSARGVKSSHSQHSLYQDLEDNDNPLNKSFGDPRDSTRNVGKGNCNCGEKNRKDRDANKKLWDKIQHMSIEQEKKQAELSRKERSIQALSSELTYREEMVLQQEHEIQRLSDRLIEVERRECLLEEEQESLRRKQEKHERDCETWQQVVNEARMKEVQLNYEDQRLNEDRRQLDDDRRQLDEDVYQSRKSIDEAVEFRSESIVIREALTAREHDLSQRELAVEQLEKEQKKTENEIKTSSQHLEALKKTNEKLKAEAAEKQADATKMYDLAQSEKAKANKEILRAEQERKHIEEQREQLSKLEGEATKLVTDKQRLEHEATRLQKHDSELKDAERELQSKRREQEREIENLRCDLRKQNEVQLFAGQRELDAEAERLRILEEKIQEQNKQERIALDNRQNDAERRSKEITAEEEEIRKKEAFLQAEDEALVQRKNLLQNFEEEIEKKQQQLALQEQELRTKEDTFETSARRSTASSAEVEELRSLLKSYQEREEEIDLQKSIIEFENATLDKKTKEMEKTWERRKEELNLREEQMYQRERAIRNHVAQAKVPRCSLPGHLTGVRSSRDDKDDSPLPCMTPSKGFNRDSTKRTKCHSIAGTSVRTATENMGRPSLVLHGSTPPHEPGVEDTVSFASSESAMPDMSPLQIDDDGEDVRSQTSLLALDETEEQECSAEKDGDCSLLSLGEDASTADQ